MLSADDLVKFRFQIRNSINNPSIKYLRKDSSNDKITRVNESDILEMIIL